MRLRSHKPDTALFVVILISIFVGFVALASASSVISEEEFGIPYYFIKHQIIYGFLPGIIFAIIGYFFPLKLLKRFAPIFFFSSLMLLALVFFPQFSYEAGGARRWLVFGSFSLQPSEILKLTAVIYLAAFLAKNEKRIKSIRWGIFPILVVFGILAFLLFLQPDVGTLSVIILGGLAMMFFSGANLWHLFLLGASGIIIGWELIKLAPYRLARLKTFLNPGIDPLGISYQINQALIAIGSGGIWGLGLGQSRQKFNFLPQPINDSIFAIFAEEVGFIGAALMILLFLFLLWRGFAIARKSPDKFSQLLASGIIFWIGIQAFMNVAAISGLLPLTGIPLPFVSYGGTSLVVTLLASGILLNISRHTV